MEQWSFDCGLPDNRHCLWSEKTTEPWDGVGVLGEYIGYEGWMRRYELHLPQDYDPGGRSPLLILFHVAGDSGPGFQAWTGLDAAADEAGFITVWPNGTPAGAYIDDTPEELCDPGPPYYWLPEDIGFTRELIAHLRDGLAIDQNRIYAAGISRRLPDGRQIRRRGAGRSVAAPRDRQ